MRASITTSPRCPLALFVCEDPSENDWPDVDPNRAASFSAGYSFARYGMRCISPATSGHCYTHRTSSGEWGITLPCGIHPAFSPSAALSVGGIAFYLVDFLKQPRANKCIENLRSDAALDRGTDKKAGMPSVSAPSLSTKRVPQIPTGSLTLWWAEIQAAITEFGSSLGDRRRSPHGYDADWAPFVESPRGRVQVRGGKTSGPIPGWPLTGLDTLSRRLSERRLSGHGNHFRMERVSPAASSSTQYPLRS